jgi:tryptophan 2,3-dioxygenase
MKLMAHELGLAMGCIRAAELRPAFKATARISRIQKQLVEAWDVLTTMTPHDYLAFRDSLGSSSGFQSWQYRLIEIRMGARDPFLLKPHRHRDEVHATLQDAFAAPGIYDEALRLLAGAGLPIPDAVLHRDLTKRHEPDAAVETAWAEVYRDAEAPFRPLRAGGGAGGPRGRLPDLALPPSLDRGAHHRRAARHGRQRRRRYLRTALEKRFFPELWSVRGKL